RRLAGFFGQRNAAQFGFGARGTTGAAAVTFDATPTVEEGDTLAIGCGTLELLHTPGETPDHLTVWIPAFKAAFIGDNYYESFPNLYTLRGTMPRWGLDYVDSLNTVLAL